MSGVCVPTKAACPPAGGSAETIAGLRARIAELEEELAWLKADAMDADVVAIGRAFRLPPSASRFLAILLRREEASKEQVYLAVYGDDPDRWPDMKTLGVFLCHIRAATRDCGVVIETIWGQGWRLTPESKPIIRQRMDCWRKCEGNNSAIENRSAS